MSDGEAGLKALCAAHADVGRLVARIYGLTIGPMYDFAATTLS